MEDPDVPGLAEGSQPFAQPIRLKVGPDGRILIPADLRRAAGIEPGGTVFVNLEDGEIRVSTWSSRLDRIRRIAAKYKKPGQSVVDEFIAEKRAEAARE